MHKQCLDFLSFFSLDETTLSVFTDSSAQQAPNYRNLRPKMQQKNFDIYLRRHKHSYLWNYFQLDLLPSVQAHGLSRFDTSDLPLFPNLTWIWFLLPEHHSLLNSAIQCPAPLQMQLLTKVPSAIQQWPALMDDSNLPSLHLDTRLLLLHLKTNSLPTPTRGRRRRREPPPSPPLSPASSTPPQRPNSCAYAPHFLSTLTFVQKGILYQSRFHRIQACWGQCIQLEIYSDICFARNASISQCGP